MTEKYKIYLTEDTKTRLINDAELFEFLRKDDTVNLNGFLKELIVNYWDFYRNSNEELLSSILSEIKSVKSLKDKEAALIASKMVELYIKRQEDTGSKSAVVTLTLSGESLKIVRLIENNLLKDTSLSGYIKNMFLSYLSIPRSKREAIIFKDTYDVLNEAIEESREITFTSSTVRGKFGIQPYLIATSKEEQFSYLLGCDVKTGKLRSFRISRMRDIFSTSASFNKSKEIEAELIERAAKSPHTMISEVHAVVKMTEAGKRTFKMIIKDRPAVTKIEGDLYYFDWSESALENYFRRFGEDALVIKPKSLKSKLRNYYGDAYKAYT